MAWIACNIVHGRIGRMWMAVRDMDIAAELIGIKLLRAKLLAFAVSSFYIGVAGALMVFLWLGAAEPEAFDINLSFQLLFMVIIGGLGSILGAFLGAAIIHLLPIVLRALPADARPQHRGGDGRTFDLHDDRRFDHRRPDRRAAWPGPDLADHEAEASGLAFPVLKTKSRRKRHEQEMDCSGASAARSRSRLPRPPSPTIRSTCRCSPTAPARSRARARGIADGMHDYLTMLNERDGGIGGVKLNVDECETGYDTKKGLECYDSVKPKNPVIVNPWSTGITLSLIPKASVDKIPILSMAYGLSASGRGDVFPWVFNPPATYWDGASEILKYLGGGSIDALKGKTIGYIYFDAGFGKEPLPLLQTLSKEVGFDLKLYPVAPADMQNQSSKWLDIRRDKPDFLVMYGWGAMNAAAVKEAVKANFPMDKFVSIWWPGENDVASAGEGAKGFKELNWHGAGADYPAFADIKKFVIDTGKSQARGRRIRRHALWPRRLQFDADRRGDRDRAEDDGQEGRHRRRRAPRPREHQPRRRASEGDRPRGLRLAVQADLRRPQQPWRDLRAAMGRREMGEGQRP